jgi:hypothetical protein
MAICGGEGTTNGKTQISCHGKTKVSWGNQGSMTAGGHNGCPHADMPSTWD